MPQAPFLITTISLFVYAIYVYFHQSQLTFMHTLYTLLLIIYNSCSSQEKTKLAAPENPEKSVQSQQNKEVTNINSCKICFKLKPPRYYHCRRCKTCIFQMDHHCDWLNCCVGLFNFKLYLHILFNLLFLGLYALFTVLIDSQLWLNSSKIPRLIASGFLLWQTQRMLFGSFEFISRNQTLIETYKRVRGPRKQKYEKLKEIFGSKFNVNWFIPTFAKYDLCDIWEPVLPIETTVKIEQLTYADEYIYGTDEEDNDKILEEKTQ